MKTADERTTLFVKSNIGTNMATSVPEPATVGHLKYILAREHFNCFPDAGECTVRNLMVKKKGVLYTLSNSMPITSVFMGESRGWLIFMEICPMKSMRVGSLSPPTRSSNLICKPCLGISETIADPCVQGKEKTSKDGSTMENTFELGKSCLGQTPARSLSADMSVTAIISMYFMEVDGEVNSLSGGCQKKDMIGSDKSHPFALPPAEKFSCADTSRQVEGILNPQQYNNRKDELLHEKGHCSITSDVNSEDITNKKTGNMVPGAFKDTRKPAKVTCGQPFCNLSIKIPKMKNRRRDVGAPLCRAANNIRNEATSANKTLSLPPIPFVISRAEDPACSSRFKVFDISESES